MQLAALVSLAPSPCAVLRVVGRGRGVVGKVVESEPPLAKVRILALNSRLVEKKDRLQKPSAVDINGDLD